MIFINGGMLLTKLNISPTLSFLKVRGMKQLVEFTKYFLSELE
jgi:hypothetical protein